MDKSIQIEKMNLKPNDTIIVYFDLDTYDICEANEIHSMVKNTFPFNDVITLPNKMNLNACDKEQVAQILEDYLKEVK